MKRASKFMNREATSSELCVIALGLLFMLAFRYMPPFEGLTSVSMEILGIFIGAMLLWIFVSISWPSIVVIVALMMTSIYSFGDVLAESIGSWVVSFVLFTTALCYVLKKVGFFKRLAVWFLTRKIVARSAWHFIAVVSLASIIVGSIMSQLTIFLIFTPIVIAIFEELGFKKNDRAPMLVTMCLLLFTMYANFTTPIAKVMPVMAMGLYTQFTGGQEISFFQYTAVGIPLTLIMLVIILLVLKLCFRADLSKLDNLDTTFLRQDIQPMSNAEKICAVVFFAVILLWVAPGVFNQFGLLPMVTNFMNQLGPAAPPMIGVVVLSIIKDKGKPIVSVDKLFSEGVSWSIILIVAATAVLGSAITNPQTGITDWIGSHIAPILNTLPPLICILLILTVAIIVTNFASDMVTVMLITSITLPMVLSGTLSGINPAALTYLIGQASTIGPATAIGSASAAIASGDGWLKPAPMFAWGMLLSLISGVLLALVGYPLASLLM